MSPIRSLTAFAAVVLVAAGLGAAEDIYLPACSTSLPFFCADAAYFKRGDRYWVELYYSVTNRSLQFVKSKSGGYEAGADMSVILFDSGSSQVSGDSKRLRLRASRYEETTSTDSVHTGVMSFPAHAGDFSLTIALTDRDTNMKSTVDVRYSIPEMVDLPTLSDIRFEEPGTQGRQRIYPNVRRSYRGDLETVPFYFEVYAGEKDLPLAVVYRVMKSEDEAVYSDTVLVTSPVSAAVHADIPATAVSNGYFRLVVGIPDGKGGFRVQRSKVFEVRSQSFYFGKDAESAADLLAYIASGGFIKAFKEADPEERKVMWDEFWKEKDPTPDTEQNEFYEEHVRRFEFANERFRTGNTAGWKTDRGRIYIVYGQPDQVESYGQDLGQEPVEIWHYRSLGRRFVFVDRTGFGDYRLSEEY
jgi:GWxTD domain-containing protein